MSIKFRCKSCQHGIKVPDDAAGKVIRCPQCSEKMRVPSGSPSPSKPKRRKVASRKTSTDDDPGSGEFLANLDLERLEDRNVQLCQKCAAELPEGETACPECGFDPEEETGAGLRRKQMAAKGIDPSTYYERLWKESFGFAGRHVGMIFKTGFILSFFWLAAALCAYMMIWVATTPPFGFYTLLTTVAFMIPFGWLFLLHSEVIGLTVQRKDKIKKFRFDFALAGMTGLKFFAWLLIYGLPFWVVFGGIGYLMQMSDVPFGLEIGLGVALFLILLFSPQALSHQAMPVESPSWMLWKTFPTLGVTFLPGLMWLLLFLVVNIPVFGIIGAVAATSGANVQEFVRARQLEGQLREATVMLDRAETAASEKIKEELIERYTEDAKIEPPPKKWSWLAIPIAGGVVCCFYVGFSSLVVARANGLFTLHLKKGLGLISQAKEVVWTGPKQKEGKVRTRKTTVPAPAGRRFLAYFIDVLIVTVVQMLIGFIGGSVAGVIAEFATLDATSLIFVLVIWAASVLMSFGIFATYFINMESGENQTTFGKAIFNMYVCTDDYQPISTMQAWIRFLSFYFLSSLLTLSIGNLIGLLRDDKKTLHDLISGTQVRMDKPPKQKKVE